MRAAEGLESIVYIALLLIFVPQHSYVANGVGGKNNAVVIDMGTPAPAPGAAPAPAAAEKKNNDTLFGPNIGVLGGGPDWTESGEKSSDVLTPDIVKGWIAKSKEVSVRFLSGVLGRALRVLPLLSGEAVVYQGYFNGRMMNAPDIRTNAARPNGRRSAPR